RRLGRREADDHRVAVLVALHAPEAHVALPAGQGAVEDRGEAGVIGPVAGVGQAAIATARIDGGTHGRQNGRVVGGGTRGATSTTRGRSAAGASASGRVAGRRLCGRGGRGAGEAHG